MLSSDLELIYIVYFLKIFLKKKRALNTDCPYVWTRCMKGLILTLTFRSFFFLNKLYNRIKHHINKANWFLNTCFLNCFVFDYVPLRTELQEFQVWFKFKFLLNSWWQVSVLRDFKFDDKTAAASAVKAD